MKRVQGKDGAYETGGCHDKMRCIDNFPPPKILKSMNDNLITPDSMDEQPNESKFIKVKVITLYL
ncbi:hypothetical protein NC653_002164 [Populus alba x Populus x berolinensis]|uniref:Uncharacterized protein n=1 Tax=Populus alba x Populus x berolinensis TaxID=444605 RepID=A0AAD6WGJ2_9ROSI|nr:hypothetical protein NC653_002164 [Populus alba x Populus x berolinensis]